MGYLGVWQDNESPKRMARAEQTEDSCGYFDSYGPPQASQDHTSQKEIMDYSTAQEVPTKGTFGHGDPIANGKVYVFAYHGT